MAAKSLPLAVAVSRIALTPFLQGCDGTHNLPRRGGYILAANHSSFIDGPLLATAVACVTRKPIHMISVAGPFHQPIWRWFLRSGRSIPLDRTQHDGGEVMMRKALAYIAMGEGVGLFPEGHVNRKMRLRAARPGLALLALESGAPVVPTGIIGSNEVLPIGTPYPKLKRIIRVRFGEPIDVSDEHHLYHKSEPVARTELVKRVTIRIMESIAALSGRTIRTE